jgi:hypothetical protein
LNETLEEVALWKRLPEIMDEFFSLLRRSRRHHADRNVKSKTHDKPPNPGPKAHGFHARDLKDEDQNGAPKHTAQGSCRRGSVPKKAPMMAGTAMRRPADAAADRGAIMITRTTTFGKMGRAKSVFPFFHLRLSGEE